MRGRTFKDVPNRAYVDEVYDGRIIIYVESEFDRKILADYLFSEKCGEVQFKPVDLPTGGGGGCIQVRQQVHEARRNRNRAFGLVDRDACFTMDKDPTVSRAEAMDIFLQIDTVEFDRAARTHLTDHVRVLAYWELENILFLEAEALRIVFSNKGQPGLTVARLIEKLRPVALALSHETAAKVVSHRMGVRKFGVSHSSNAAMVQAEAEAYLTRHTGSGCTAQLAEVHAKVLAFGLDDGTWAWWVQISRALDGKSLVHRIAKILDTKEHDHLCTELANSYVERATIPVELQRHIDAILAAAA